MSGEVVEVNEALTDKPELVNTDPYGDGWMMRMRLSDPEEVDEMMTAEEYEEYVEKEVRRTRKLAVAMHQLYLDPLRSDRQHRYISNASQDVSEMLDGHRHRFDRSPLRHDPRRRQARPSC